MAKIFISYRRTDDPYAAGRICDKFKSHFGAESIFFDIDSYAYGTDFREDIDKKVSQCDVLLAVIGDDWLCPDATENGKSRLHDPKDFVALELETALRRKIPVIPVLVGGAKIPNEDVLPDSLKDIVYRHAAELRADTAFDSQVSRLIEGIERLLADDVPAESQVTTEPEQELRHVEEAKKKMSILENSESNLVAGAGNQRRVRLTVHRAFFTKSRLECYFINITNLSFKRELEITHVWFDCVPQVHVTHQDRPLPKRLKIDETWETWIEVRKLPDWIHDEPFTLARARLSTGAVIKSIENKNVPGRGAVPGGPISDDGRGGE